MKILFDHQIFLAQQYGGISRYFFELMEIYKKNKDINIECTSRFSNNYYLKNAGYKINSLPYKYKFKGSGRILNVCNFANKKITKGILKKGCYDIFHPTYYEPYFLENIGARPFVVTVYDMIHEIFPQYFSNKDITAQQKKILVNSASRVIAISNSTKKDLIDIYGIDKNKIDVIYLASSLNKTNLISTSIDVPNRFILFVGNRSGYKNFNLFLEAIIPLLKNDKTLFLVCAGAGVFSKEEQQKISENGIERKVIKFAGDDNTLINLYSKALAFVFPSLYEGFGIPILEAMQCGCPAILSNNSSFTEVGEQAAEYFNPQDKESIKNSVEKVIYNENIRKELINLGFEQCKKFSWEKTAEETLYCYRRVL